MYAPDFGLLILYLFLDLSLEEFPISCGFWREGSYHSYQIDSEKPGFT